ncbi:hypothetical protein JYU34_005678, partial [Plutella xylostella]
EADSRERGEVTDPAPEEEDEEQWAEAVGENEQVLSERANDAPLDQAPAEVASSEASLGRSLRPNRKVDYKKYF